MDAKVLKDIGNDLESIERVLNETLQTFMAIPHAEVLYPNELRRLRKASKVFERVIEKFAEEVAREHGIVRLRD